MEPSAPESAAFSLDGLNKEQVDAVRHDGGPLLIVAGAGTGKTRVLTHRIARLIAEGASADRILAVTFTNKAAEEMKRRIEALVPGRGSRVWMHTFHSFAARLLRQHARLLGLNPHFTIYDQDDQKKLVVDALKELGAEKEKSKAGLYVSLISRAKDDLLDAKSYAIHAQTSSDRFRQNAALVYERYQKRLDQAGGLDFGDLLLKACELLKEFEQVRAAYQDLFLHVLVDEYQDTNHAQYVLTKTLSAKHRNLCVVGDPDQCLPPETEILTPQGARRLDAIREGDEVVAASGWGKTGAAVVGKVMVKPYQGELLEIRLASGKVLTATPNHICFWRLDETSVPVPAGERDAALMLPNPIWERPGANVEGDASFWRLVGSGHASFRQATLTRDHSFCLGEARELCRGAIAPSVLQDRVQDDVIEEIRAVPYSGRVYDLSVPGFRNFVADGVVVHNSVYGWRGADIRNIMEFERDFKDARVVVLEENYRSTSRILTAASAVIERNKYRKPKSLWTRKDGGEPVLVQEIPNELEEARWSVRRVQALLDQGHALRDFAVFYRTNAQSRQFEEAFRQAGLAYRLIGSLRFYERKEVKDALAYARVLLNPSDQVSLARILNVPNRGIGKTSQDRLEAFAAQKETTLHEALAQQVQVAGLTPGARRSIDELVGLFEKLREELTKQGPAAMMAQILERTGYLEALEAETETDPEAAGRVDNLQELVNALKEFEETREGATLSDFLQGVALQSSADTYDSETGAVTLMTIHLAKGLEFPVVFLTGLEEGLFPIGAGNSSPEELEEERRLCYVGMTRAKERLFLTYASTRRIFGQTYANLPSRFILEANLVRETSPLVSPAGAPEPRSETPPAPRGPASIKPGSRVKHASFGKGVVMSVSGSGEAMKATVRFDSGIQKKLILRYAPLEAL